MTKTNNLQISLFDSKNGFKLSKPIRLITLFSGYDSQALALKYLGIEFEHYKTCEWAIKSIQALKDLHFKNDTQDYSADYSKEEIKQKLVEFGISANYNEPLTKVQVHRLGELKQRQIYNNIYACKNFVNVQKVTAEDLNIVDTDKYDYILTYSFPCQDLSRAGKGKGMVKGGGTRSGLLWEVERILDECNNLGHLPQILLMENVPDVIGTKNIAQFVNWRDKLESLGYKCYWQVLNAKDYGVPQNRERCFMISILGDYYYQFPSKSALKYRLKDLLEEKVEEKYYLSERALNGALNTNFSVAKLENKFPRDGIVPTLMARDYKDPKLIEITSGQSQGNRVYDTNGLSVSLCASGGGLGAKTGLYLEPKIIYEEPLEKEGWHRKACEVLNVEGISTCITTQSNNLLQKIKEPTLVEKNLKKTIEKNNGEIPEFADLYNARPIKNGISGTLLTSCGNDCGCGSFAVIEANERFYKQAAETISEHKVNVGDTIDAFNKKVNSTGVAPTITTRPEGFKTAILPITKDYRIRKLTPKECFRLMGVKDEDFDKIAKNQSNSSLYHLAGDSIVANVLMAIFKQML